MAGGFPSALPAQTSSLWGPGDTPGTPTSTDPDPYTLGVKFRSDVPGSVVGVKFYKGDATNGGIHTGHLWLNADGSLLGSVTFTNETASGWQQQAFGSPIPILANTTYVIGYVCPQGHFSIDQFYFTASGHNNPPLRALQSGVDGGNGVFNAGATPTFPTTTFNDSNYWVDVLFNH